MSDKWGVWWVPVNGEPERIKGGLSMREATAAADAYRDQQPDDTVEDGTYLPGITAAHAAAHAGTWREFGKAET